MSEQAFLLLSPADEDALHFSRLLTVEERPFLRLANRLQTTQPSVINTFPRQLPSPPPETNEGDIALGDETEGLNPAAAFDYKKQDLERRQWRKELLLEFATIENTLARIQLLHDSNERERARYAEQKTKILESAQSVRSNTSDLRVQLQAAQQTLASRKEYDALVDQITADKTLSPRDEQEAAMEKLRAEIADLQQEQVDFASTWQERKSLFTRVLDESQQMMRVIKGVKESVEEDEGEGEGEGEEGTKDEDTVVAKDDNMIDEGAATPAAARGSESKSRQATPGSADRTRSQHGTPMKAATVAAAAAAAAAAAKRSDSQPVETPAVTSTVDIDDSHNSAIAADEMEGEDEAEGEEGLVTERMDVS